MFTKLHIFLALKPFLLLWIWENLIYVGFKKTFYLFPLQFCLTLFLAWITVRKRKKQGLKYSYSFILLTPFFNFQLTIYTHYLTYNLSLKNQNKNKITFKSLNKLKLVTWAARETKIMGLRLECSSNQVWKPFGRDLFYKIFTLKKF